MVNLRNHPWCEMTWYGPPHINMMVADALAPNMRQVISSHHVELTESCVHGSMLPVGYAAYVSRYNQNTYFGWERSGGGEPVNLNVNDGFTSSQQ